MTLSLIQSVQYLSPYFVGTIFIIDEIKHSYRPLQSSVVLQLSGEAGNCEIIEKDQIYLRLWTSRVI